MSSLNKKAFGGLLILFLVMAFLLFATAGTLAYWQAWAFLAVYFASSLALTLYLMKKDPALLARRMSGGPFAEKQPVQKIIMGVASLGFVGLLVVPAVDHRFGWSHVPLYVTLAGERSSRSAGSAFFSCSGKTVLAPRPSNWRSIKRSYRLAHTLWCATRCMLLRC